MKVHGDIEGVNLHTGECFRRVSGDGESRLERIEFDPAGRPLPRSLISVPNTVHSAAIAACEKKAAVERAELIAEIGTHIHHMNIYHLRAWFQRRFGAKLVP